jgi:hypothetical protein
MATVAEILGDEPVATDNKPFLPPRLPDAPPFPEPGLYFGMPDEVYHAIHACSASGLKHMSISSMDYWASSLLNPENEREEKAAKASGQLTPRQLGQAYHTFICEGPVKFSERYAVALDKDVMKMEAAAKKVPFCVTTADLRIAIDEAGAKPKGTAKEPLIEQLLDLVPEAMVWDREVAIHSEVHAGKLMISPTLFRRIAIAHAMIAGDPQLKSAFTGGHAEVSLFWYDEETGVPMKARLDYLKMNHLVDLKSFGNQQGKPIQRAIDSAISNNKYYVPVAVYLEGIEAVKKLVKEKKGDAVFRFYADGTECGDTAEDVSWCWKWAHQPEPEVLFVFQQTGIAPVTRGRIMTLGSHYTATKWAVGYLRRKWKRCALAYGTDPWLDFEPVVATVDEELPPWASDFGGEHS